MLKPARILIVDDQAYVRHTLRSLLAQQQHWQIYEAESAKVALDLIPDIRPHLMVIDIVMPEMNGLELACEIRQLKDPPKIVLMSSHYNPEEARVLSRLFGDGGFVTKSEADKTLIPAISHLLPEECQAKATTA